ncbi:hypothetical protein PtA15_4A629 [Puccinia triticina]|uniref:Uncharacterized protein n=1 Tax=Puccinia triticina TaxID=208348 RepID=A0ABY7CN06_9BASI|nr:uncharacterized protein PtA15_4A629 [Puccinia triticina]WAQ84177.1 hypothetical protein PtA15_4A629 [Puccinia triticina]
MTGEGAQEFTAEEVPDLDGFVEATGDQEGSNRVEFNATDAVGMAEQFPNRCVVVVVGDCEGAQTWIAWSSDPLTRYSESGDHTTSLIPSLRSVSLPSASFPSSASSSTSRLFMDTSFAEC